MRALLAVVLIPALALSATAASLDAEEGPSSVQGKSISVPDSEGMSITGSAGLSGDYRYFRLTGYYGENLHPVSSGGTTIKIVDLKSKPKKTYKVMVSKHQAKLLAIEGSGRVVIDELGEERAINIHEGSTYALLPKGKLGKGRGGYLVPFFSLAGDVGSKPWMDTCTRGGRFFKHEKSPWVHIQELEGIWLGEYITPESELLKVVAEAKALAAKNPPPSSLCPKGVIYQADGDWYHGGCAVVADTGAAIYGAHLDFFCGFREWCPDKGWQSKSGRKSWGGKHSITRKVGKYYGLVRVKGENFQNIPQNYAFGLRTQHGNRCAGSAKKQDYMHLDGPCPACWSADKKKAMCSGKQSVKSCKKS